MKTMLLQTILDKFCCQGKMIGVILLIMFLDMIICIPFVSYRIVTTALTEEWKNSDATTVAETQWVIKFLISVLSFYILACDHKPLMISNAICRLFDIVLFYIFTEDTEAKVIESIFNWVYTCIAILHIIICFSTLFCKKKLEHKVKAFLGILVPAGMTTAVALFAAYMKDPETMIKDDGLPMISYSVCTVGSELLAGCTYVFIINSVEFPHTKEEMSCKKTKSNSRNDYSFPVEIGDEEILLKT